MVVRHAIAHQVMHGTAQPQHVLLSKQLQPQLFSNATANLGMRARRDKRFLARLSVILCANQTKRRAEVQGEVEEAMDQESQLQRRPQ